MDSLDERLAQLPAHHRGALEWFATRAGHEMPWPKPLDDGTLLVSKAKGIYRPEWTSYALSLRQSLIEAYGARCALTDCDAVEALEAAHILPYDGPATNNLPNGILLRSDIHTLFDLGSIATDPSTMALLLSPALADTTYGELAGRTLRVPAEEALRPSKSALQQHRLRSGL